VPPRLAFVIATSAREQLLEQTNTPSFLLRPAHFRSTFRQRQRSRNLKFHEVAKKAIAARYNDTQERTELAVQKSPEKYHFAPTSLFDRKRSLRKTTKLDARQFGVKTKEIGRQIQIEIWVDGIDYDSISTVEISGLTKYLPAYDSIKLNANISDSADVFHVWGVIEDALISRSRFFTLIDIYGHYANRGDTVRVNCNWRLDIDKDTLRVLNYFNRTENCGDFHLQKKVLEELDLSIGQFTAIVERLRSIRFDLRTPKTHPIIGDGRILCTYPFPLLSSRALVESRVKFVPPIDNNLEELFVAAS
jgi:DNA (cytosine-5)-methyltransferase 1